MLSDSLSLRFYFSIWNTECVGKYPNSRWLDWRKSSLPSPTFPLSPWGLRTFPDFHLSSLRPGRSPSYPALTLPRVPQVLAPRWSFLTQHLTIPHDLGSAFRFLSDEMFFFSLEKQQQQSIIVGLPIIPGPYKQASSSRISGKISPKKLTMN